VETSSRSVTLSGSRSVLPATSLLIAVRTYLIGSPACRRLRHPPRWITSEALRPIERRKMRIIAGIDFETTTNVIEEARITEIGAVLFDADTWKPVGNKFECFVYDTDYPPQSEEVIRITGITDDVLKTQGIPPAVALGDLLTYIHSVEYVIAHNKAFDQPIFEKEARHFFPANEIKRKWLCSYMDVEYPAHFKCKKLSHLALDHGITVRPETLHRATGDILLMGELLAKGGYTAEQIIAYSETPWVYVRAEVSYARKDAAKARGYRWQAVGNKNFPGAWVKMVKKNRVAAEIKDSDFKVLILEEENA
jgi:DNA polymerase III epsilon subunit-like protein